MGYESRIYIVEKTEHLDRESGKKWALTIARFDMCKYTSLSDKLRKMPATDYYIYADDGNTKVFEDCYEKPLTEASVAEVIRILETDVMNGEDYRRIFPLLAALKALEEHKEQWQDLAVLHFGY